VSICKWQSHNAFRYALLKDKARQFYLARRSLGHHLSTWHRPAPLDFVHRPANRNHMWTCASATVNPFEWTSPASSPSHGLAPGPRPGDIAIMRTGSLSPCRRLYVTRFDRPAHRGGIAAATKRQRRLRTMAFRGQSQFLDHERLQASSEKEPIPCLHRARQPSYLTGWCAGGWPSHGDFAENSPQLFNHLLASSHRILIPGGVFSFVHPHRGISFPCPAVYFSPTEIFQTMTTNSQTLQHRTPFHIPRSPVSHHFTRSPAGRCWLIIFVQPLAGPLGLLPPPLRIASVFALRICRRALLTLACLDPAPGRPRLTSPYSGRCNFGTSQSVRSSGLTLRVNPPLPIR